MIEIQPNNGRNDRHIANHNFGGQGSFFGRG